MGDGGWNDEEEEAEEEEGGGGGGGGGSVGVGFKPGSSLTFLTLSTADRDRCVFKTGVAHLGKKVSPIFQHLFGINLKKK